MRKALTPQEARLWGALKRWRADGFHFRRQAPFRGYFLDFVCYERRLVVEVDGGQHAEEVHAAHDATRDRVLTREGFRVLRVWNSEVNTNFCGVLEAIRAAVEDAPSSLPLRGEGQRGAAAQGGGRGADAARMTPPTPPLRGDPPQANSAVAELAIKDAQVGNIRLEQGEGGRS